MKLRVIALLATFILAGCRGGEDQSLPNGLAESDLPTSFTNSLGMKLVKIPSGTFTMGEEGLEKYNDEGKTATLPLHEVELSVFYLADKETTKAQFREYVKAKGFSWSQYPQVDPTATLPSLGKGQVWDTRTLSPAQISLLHFPEDDFPITNIGWEDVEHFCKWLSEKERLVYRLPTEAEWEYACRAGTRTIYWWGDKFDPKMARIGGDYVKFRTIASPFAPVGSYPPNPWGLYDMHGNVFEWVSDYFSWDYYRHSPRKNPKGPTFGEFHVMRGGAGCDLEGDPQHHAGARETSDDSGWTARGFRIACDAASVAKSLPTVGAPAKP